MQDGGLVQKVLEIADGAGIHWVFDYIYSPRLASLLNSSSFETTSNTWEARVHSSHLEPLRGVVQPFSPLDPGYPVTPTPRGGNETLG